MLARLSQALSRARAAAFAA